VPDELLTVKEVAELLKLNQQTIRNIIDRGELGHVRVGQRRVRVRQSQLDAFLAAGESGPQPAEPNPWREVSEAASTVMAAVRAQDREALDRAELEAGGRRSRDPLGRGQHSHLIPRPPLDLR
jgi:excisionase family DNA binding protein